MTVRALGWLLLVPLPGVPLATGSAQTTHTVDFTFNVPIAATTLHPDLGRVGALCAVLPDASVQPAGERVDTTLVAVGANGAFSGTVPVTVTVPVTSNLVGKTGRWTCRGVVCLKDGAPAFTDQGMPGIRCRDVIGGNTQYNPSSYDPRRIVSAQSVGWQTGSFTW